MIYTTNAIESLNSTVRRSVRVRGHFPNEEAALKLIWLQLREVTQKWKRPSREWHLAKAQFALLFGERFEMHQ
jgi:putative transposase